jgi:hypothetical protein
VSIVATKQQHTSLFPSDRDEPRARRASSGEQACDATFFLTIAYRLVGFFLGGERARV